MIIKEASKCFIALFALAFLLAVTFACSPANGAQSKLILTELYPDTATKNELDEYIALTNPGSRSVNIEDWSITDNEGSIIFPSFSIAPGETIYVTRNASVFVEHISTVKSVLPVFEYGSDAHPDVSQMQTAGRFMLRNSGDEVILQDRSGREVDVVLYGDSAHNCEGWQGEPLRKPREGMVFNRKARDTDQCEDWLLLPSGASYHAPANLSCFGNATAFVSPDCSFFVLQHEIDNASTSLYINLYQLESPYLMDVVLDALQRGVKVYLLLEGSPVGGIKDESLYIADKIGERGGAVRFSDDPYINHAKYAIVDNETTIVMTENWKNTGVPYNNSFGNRGWGIVIKHEAVADYFKAVFFDDFYRGNEFTTETGTIKDVFMSREPPRGSYIPVFVPLTITSNFSVIPVLAPDTAMSDKTIARMITHAKEKIFVQQFSTGRFWGEKDNYFIAALIEAARRGCDVKILLDSRYIEGGNNNDEVVSWVNEVSREEELNLEAKLADLDASGLLKVHTKGLIVDDNKVLISSLNWNANSVYNREAGVIIESEEIASFYADVFLHDWNESVGGGEEDKEGEKRAPAGIRIVYVALTLIISFFVFWLVKWYKRI